MNTHQRTIAITAGAAACFAVFLLISISSYEYMNRTAVQRKNIQQLSREWFMIKKYTIDISRAPDDTEFLERWREKRSEYGKLMAKIDTQSVYPRVRMVFAEQEEKLNRLVRRWEAISLTLEELDRLTGDETEGNLGRNFSHRMTLVSQKDQIDYLITEFYADSSIFENWIDEAFLWLDSFSINQMKVFGYLFFGFLFILTAVLLLVLNTSRLYTTRMEMLQAALDSLREGCIITDSATRVIHANHSARALLEYPDDKSLEGRHFRQVLDPETERELPFSTRFSPLQETKGALVAPEAVLRVRRNRMVHVFVCTPLRTDSRTKHTFYSLTDVTPIVTLQEELARRKSTESYNTSVSSIAHALNNSFMGILGNLELAILSTESASREAGFLKESKQAVMKSRDLVARLMNLTSGESRSRKLILISTLIGQAVSAAEKSSGARVILSGMEENDSYVVVNEQKVQEALEMILKNATGGRTTPESVYITVLSYTAPYDRNPSCRITIRYIGTAFDREKAAMVYAPISGPGYHNRGIDFAVAASIIRDQDGRLQIETRNDGETQITITLPAEDGRVNTGKTAPDARLRILLLDDEKSVRDIGAKMLTQLGHSVTTAATGEEALSVFRKALVDSQPFDVAILDLSITEGMDGTETLVELRKLDPEFPAIVTSGYTEAPVMLKYEDFGFLGALPKPYDMGSLSHILLKIQPHTRLTHS